MKTALFTLALAAASLAARAQTQLAAPAASAEAPADAYTAQMTATIAELMSTGDPAALRAVAAKLERAASARPADWLPRYYQAYALLINVFQSKEEADAKDKTLDQAEAALAQARKLHGDESELLVLQAYIYQARLGVAPTLRAMKYSPLVNEAVAQAKRLNPANPRAYLVGANNVNFMPKMFGGGPEAAKPLYEEAQAKYTAFQPSSPLMPNWGQRQLQARLQQYAAAATN
ncbi:hypothetical protein [Hymenobacter properus]|uniref:Tetratricopeptide repeat protein n=1 Tax=Hymenobacter properus TaxID=2791026 RepID=A0A931BPT5_9BACT|nr:hypothetical protein [Hymenobacter properus]MBF9144273.1 hypothetical protein [Hymenobacter properus]MBR7723091.1 hypothetical protein [Microvirga sp. SRT04]